MLQNRAIVVCIFAALAFWPIAFLVETQKLFDAANAFGVTLGFAVIWAYLPGVIAAWRTGHPLKQGHYLVLGILATWIAMVARTIWLWTWRWMGEPAGGLDHLLMAFVAWLIVIGGILHLLSPRVDELGQVPRAGWISLRNASIVGGCLWALIAALRYGAK